MGILSFLFGPKEANMESYTNLKEQNITKTIFQFTVNNIDGDPVDLSKYSGKIIILINVASKCGLTPQYTDIEAFYRAHKDEDVVILGFPANNFLGQEPGTNEEIKEFCQKNYGVSFPVFSKISVKGKDMHPLYNFLTNKNENGVMDTEVKWNFQKYLIDQEGRLVTFFDPKTSINDPKIMDAINSLR